MLVQIRISVHCETVRQVIAWQGQGVLEPSVHLQEEEDCKILVGTAVVFVKSHILWEITKLLRCANSTRSTDKKNIKNAEKCLVQVFFLFLINLLSFSLYFCCCLCCCCQSCCQHCRPAVVLGPFWTNLVANIKVTFSLRIV